MAPAGFWRNFEKSRLVEMISDQGPWGGHQAIYWNTGKENLFNANKVIAFAKKNGWELLDSMTFRSNELKQWEEDETPIFPLSNEGFNPRPAKNAAFKDFPRWINSDLTVFSFKTKWVSIQPGNDSSIVANGFVLISADGQKMSVYHIWGE